jgi:hypothetical protein
MARVLLKLELDCGVDAAWRAIRSPQVMRQVAAPLLGFWSLEEGASPASASPRSGFPDTWPSGEHRVEVSALTVLTVGEQIISISYPQQTLRRRRDGVRMVRDRGRATSGPLSVVTRFEHTMTVAPAGEGRTLFRDQLKFSAGILTPLVWPLFWVFWQWRGFRIRRLARSWSGSGRRPRIETRAPLASNHD